MIRTNVLTDITPGTVGSKSLLSIDVPQLRARCSISKVRDTLKISSIILQDKITKPWRRENDSGAGEALAYFPDNLADFMSKVLTANLVRNCAAAATSNCAAKLHFNEYFILQ